MGHPNRWNDGPTISIREGETERTAGLRALQAPLPPDLYPGRAPEDPNQRRDRYQAARRRDVSDPDLWDFLHGFSGERDSSNYEEAVESENLSGGDFSLVTDQVEDDQAAHGASPENEEEYV